jgi:hypothetical protein
MNYSISPNDRPSLPEMAELPQPPGAGRPTKRPVRVRDVRSARKVLSRIILELQRGPAERDTRDTYRLLVYSLSVFAQMYQDAELEERICGLENAASSSTSPQVVNLPHTSCSNVSAWRESV